MAEVKANSGDGWVELEFQEGLYPIDAIYGAAYVFIDRCYVHLDRTADKRVTVKLRAKAAVSLDAALIAGEFENELLGQAWRRQITDENKQLLESITTRALSGAAGSPSLDDLLATDLGADTAFEDPLGIAMSWEDKYAKKKAAKDVEGAEPAAPVADAVPEPTGSAT